MDGDRHSEVLKAIKNKSPPFGDCLVPIAWGLLLELGFGFGFGFGFPFALSVSYTSRNPTAIAKGMPILSPY